MNIKIIDEKEQFAQCETFEITHLLWETKAIPWLKVSMEIRSSGGRDILDSEEFEFRTDSYLLNPSGKFTIKEEQVYDLKAIPTLYLLDKDKTVLLKDATAPAIEAYLMQHQ